MKVRYNYVCSRRVAKLEKLKQVVSGKRKDPDKPPSPDNSELSEEVVGWYLTFEGSHEKNFIAEASDPEPPFKAGMAVDVIISTVAEEAKPDAKQIPEQK